MDSNVLLADANNHKDVLLREQGKMTAAAGNNVDTKKEKQRARRKRWSKIEMKEKKERKKRWGTKDRAEVNSDRVSPQGMSSPSAPPSVVVVPKVSVEKVAPPKEGINVQIARRSEQIVANAVFAATTQSPVGDAPKKKPRKRRFCRISTPADDDTPKQDVNTLKQDSNIPKQDVNTPKQDVNTPKQDVNTPKQDVNVPNQDGNIPKHDDNKSPPSNENNPNKKARIDNSGDAEPKKIEKKNKFLICASAAIHTGSVVVFSQPENTPYNLNDTITNKPIRTVTTTSLSKSASPSSSSSIPPSIVIKIRPLLVLDINGIFCRRLRAADMDKSKRYRPTTARIANTNVILRTDAVETLGYLAENFTLAVWTSAKRENAKALVNVLFPSTVIDRLLFLWGQNYCVSVKMPTPPVIPPGWNWYKPLFLKPLSKVWNEFPLWNETNTLLIDDDPQKCPHPHVANGIHPPPICGEVGFADETNQLHQSVFFKALANYWEGDGCDDGAKSMRSFLENCEGASGMGWRGGEECKAEGTKEVDGTDDNKDIPARI
eukprot:CAMPEP_0172492258 /NCGR_PEP_ID=MMETSP1066-20121228/23339_1 /TAXON_ID=671091 /ORGANISM="Coscinodiscus wailesii, Strain CCMP2513" /LENGTH=545 /DNA_ID=CAMNT_0013261769 /DNA_START=63 /DNA_END=1700 /DNA_ORIENTATION=-